MFRPTACARLARGPFHRSVSLCASAKLVPVGQPSASDTTWYSRSPLVGSTKGAPSIEQAVTERVYERLSEQIATEVARKQTKAAIDESVQRHNAAEGVSSSSSSSVGEATSSPSNTLNTRHSRVNITQDVLDAAKADFNDMIKDAKVYTHDGQTLTEAEEAKKYVEQLDLSAMPSIPGVSKEELAVKLLEFQKIKAQQAAQHLSGDAERNRRLNQIEVMRMSLQPKQFKEFMEGMKKAAEASEAELELMRTMSPQQLYAYQQKKERARIFWQWANFVSLWVMAFGGTVMMYYLMYEYFAI